MTSSLDTIREFVEAWGALDTARLAGYFADDGCYHDMPSKPVRGRANRDEGRQDRRVAGLFRSPHLREGSEQEHVRTARAAGCSNPLYGRRFMPRRFVDTAPARSVH